MQSESGSWQLCSEPLGVVHCQVWEPEGKDCLQQAANTSHLQSEKGTMRAPHSSFSGRPPFPPQARRSLGTLASSAERQLPSGSVSWGPAQCPLPSQLYLQAVPMMSLASPLTPRQYGAPQNPAKPFEGINDLLSSAGWTAALIGAATAGILEAEERALEGESAYGRRPPLSSGDSHFMSVCFLPGIWVIADHFGACPRDAGNTAKPRETRATVQQLLIIRDTGKCHSTSCPSCRSCGAPPFTPPGEELRTEKIWESLGSKIKMSPRCIDGL